MGFKSLYTDLKAKLALMKDSDNQPLFKYVGIWNNQLADIVAENNNNWMSITYPAVFVQVIVKDIEQLGYLDQKWNTDISLHIIDDYYNGEHMEENTHIFDVIDTCWNNFQQVKLDKCVVLCATDQLQDYTHSNVYHFTQTYKSNYIHIYDDKTITTSGVTLAFTTSGMTITY